jgi:hypothetical protein
LGVAIPMPTCACIWSAENKTINRKKFFISKKFMAVHTAQRK